MGRAAITLSTSDPAGANMLKIFKDLGFSGTERSGVLEREDVYLISISHFIVPEDEYRNPTEPNPYPIDYDAIASSLDIDYYVVASRHWAKSGQPCLTAHATGNFGEAMYGGRSHELQMIPPNQLRNVYMAMLRNPPSGFLVSLEATHHSPTQFKTPMFFAEVGSSEAQWDNSEACRYLVDSCLRGIESKEEAPAAIGFGGGHYCPKFSTMEREHAFGHIAAKYALSELTEELIAQMVLRTAGGVEKAYIEDGVKSVDRKRIEASLDNLGIDHEVV
jgi:D-aminoacyl-tRNA deacylase